jgi:hypothetical protein
MCRPYPDRYKNSLPAFTTVILRAAPVSVDSRLRTERFATESPILSDTGDGTGRSLIRLETSLSTV